MAFFIATIFYRFLFLLLVLEPIVALPSLTRRDTTWDDSPGQAIIDIGAAGFGTLNQFWNQLIMPPTETRYSPDPSLSQPETPNTPEWSTPPVFEPNMMKKCSASTSPIGAPDDQLPGEVDIPTPNGLIPDPDVEYVGDYVQQNVKTG